MEFWKYLEKKFQRSPSQLLAIKALISSGISVRREQGSARFYSGNIEIKSNAVARGLHTDRRVILELSRKITEDSVLSPMFSRLMPLPNLGVASRDMGFGAIEIIPISAYTPGIVAGVLGIIAREGINVRQVIVDDPEISSDPRAVIVTDRPIDSSLIPEIRIVNGVRAVVIL